MLTESEIDTAFKDMTYFTALKAMRTLLEQHDYFQCKYSESHPEMIQHSQDLIDQHKLILERLTVEYAERHRIKRDAMPSF